MLAALQRWLPRSRVEQAALVVFGLALFTIPEQLALTKNLRASILVILAATMLVHPAGRWRLRQNFCVLPVVLRCTLGLLGSTILLSTALGHTAIIQRLLGYSGDNEGLLVWMSYLILGLGLAQAFRTTIENYLMLYVLSGLLAIMLAYTLPDLLQGFRLGGFLYQATGMGIWCALLLFWLLAKTDKNNGRRWLRTIALIFACVGLFLSQSRIAIVVSEVLLLVRGLSYWRGKQLQRLLPIAAILVFLLVTPFLSNSVFTRLHSRSVEQGVNYRADLYKLGMQRIADGHLLVGAGASSADTILNNGPHSEPIRDTLEQGFVFWYAHDLFLDTGLLFGGIAAICLAYLTLFATWGYCRSQSFVLLATWALLLANALVNTPSLELTSLFFMALFYGALKA